jgi:hypothetical protein
MQSRRKFVIGTAAAGVAALFPALRSSAQNAQSPRRIDVHHHFEPDVFFAYRRAHNQDEGGLIKNPDPTPFVRVYPGGRVLIHYPAYMKLAGDYELVLSDEEVEELLSSFADREVLTLAPDALNQMAAEVRAEQGLDVPEGDHGVATVVEIHAEEFTPAEEDQPPLLNVDQRIVALELPPAEAVTAPRFSKLRAVAVGVRKLEALAERDDLQPVELAPTDAAAQPAPGTGVQR